jgi:carbon-monoxide dehydrogenase large subunit
MAMITEAPKRHAVGQSMKRKEDPRFIRGAGRYIDDITLPGMLYLALVHSPYPHARIVSIDKSAALAMPGVKAVITGEDLVAANLGWIPTFHGYDKQMVLAVGKALFQYQEVAGVVATSREAAIDAAELVEVDYDVYGNRHFDLHRSRRRRTEQALRHHGHQDVR